MSWSAYSGSSGSSDRSGVWTSRGDMARRSSVVGGQGAGRRGAGPQYWNGGFTANGESPHQLTTASNYRTLEPIDEEMASPPRSYLNGAANAVSPNEYNGRRTTPTINGNNRRHSEGDLLEMSSAAGGPRFNKKAPVSANRQLARQGSGEGRSPRKKSSDAAQKDIDAFSDVSGKSRVSVGSEDSITSASQLANRRRSEPSVNPMRKTSSTVSLVSNEQRRKSSAGVPSVASMDRRPSVVNGLDKASSPQPAQDRRLSVLTLGGGGAGSSPFTNIEIPMDFLDSTRSRLRKMMTPIILLVVVIVIVVSLSVAIYFAVALKDSQDKQIEFLRAALHLSITKDKYSRNLEKLMKDGALESVKTSCCQKVDELYTASILWNDFRGCEVETLQQTKIQFSLYFLNKTAISEESVVGVLAPAPTSTYQIVDINGFELNVSNSVRDVNLEVVKKPENFYGVHSPELKPKTVVNDIVLNTTNPETVAVTQSLIKSLTFIPAASTTTTATTSTTTTTTTSTVATTQVTPTSTTTPSTTFISTGTTSPSVVQNDKTREAVRETPLTNASTMSPSEAPTYTTPAETSTATTTQALTTATAGTTAAKISLTTTATKVPTLRSTVTLTIQVLNKLCQDNPQAGIMPHPLSCTDFIQCEFEQAKTRPCPPGLIFNTSLTQCVLPEPDSPCAPKPCDNLNGGYYADPINCTQYIMCEFSRAVVKSCTDTMVWDESSKNCVPRGGSHQCSLLQDT